jgi:hypothetical protein
VTRAAGWCRAGQDNSPRSAFRQTRGRVEARGLGGAGIEEGTPGNSLREWAGLGM